MTNNVFEVTVVKSKEFVPIWEICTELVNDVVEDVMKKIAKKKAPPKKTKSEVVKRRPATQKSMNLVIIILLKALCCYKQLTCL